MPDEPRLCRMTPSTWKSGLSTPTYYISHKKKKGFFRRIQEAVEEVPPNSRVEIVGGGTFMEKVVINKPLELCAAKTTETPIVTFRSTVVTVQADDVVLDGLTIQAESTMPSVVLSSGHSLLRRCSIRGLEVCGSAAPSVEECRFGEAKGHSIHVRQRAGGTYFRNVISGSGGFSVLVETIGECNFSYNTIAGSHLGQICIRPNEEGVVKPRFCLNRVTDDLEEAQQHLHAHDGTSFSGGVGTGGSVSTGGGQLNIFKLVDLAVKQTGMRVQLIPSNKNKVEINIEDDDVTDPALQEESHYAGIVVQGKGVQPHLTQNTVAACKLHGLVVKGGAGGVYEANYFTGNKGWAVYLEETHVGDIPSFTHNHISANGGGVKISGCPATFEQHNVLFGNRGPQILLDGGHAKIVIDQNMFRNCARSAVWCIGGGGGQVSRNDFESCGIGIRLERMADPTVSQNTFDGGSIGVFATNGCKGTFLDCIFTDLTKVGALVQNSAHPSFYRCSFYSCSQGLQVLRHGSGLFDHCTVQDTIKSSVEISEHAFPTFSNSVIRDGGGTFGVLFSKHSGGQFTRNQIFRHSGSSISIVDGSDPVMESNIIGLSPHDGVIISKGGCGVFRNNIIYECMESGVVITGPGSAPVFRQNYILDCGRQGMLVFDPLGHCVCEKNVFLGSRRCHVLLSINEPQVLASLTTSKAAGKSLFQTIGRVKGGAPSEDALRRPTATFGGTSTAGKSSTFDGVKAMPQRHIVIRNNVMWKSIYAGVIVDGNIHVFLHGNSISNSRHAVLIYGDGSHVVMVQNGFENCESGVTIGEDASADVISNIFQHIGPGSAVATLNAFKASISFNTIIHCDNGIYLRSVTGDALIFANLIRHSKKFAIYQNPDAERSTRIYKNVLKGNGRDIYVGGEETHQAPASL